MALLHVGITAEDLRDEKVLNVHVDLPSCFKGQNPKHTSAFPFTSSRLQLKKTKKQHILDVASRYALETLYRASHLAWEWLWIPQEELKIEALDSDIWTTSLCMQQLQSDSG